MTYKEKLRDPRWQKKRLEILDRDNFTCQLCGDKHTTLHVHHNSYSENPWDVENSELITYCADCHRFIEFTKGMKMFNKIIKIIKRDSSIGLFLYCSIIDDLGSKWVVINLLNPDIYDDIKLVDFLDDKLTNDLNNLFNN